MSRILEAKAGSTIVLMGNEAIARGALESRLSVATTYPGTPASEIGDTLAKVAKDAGIYFEYSTNEKVATEVAIGAAASGLRALVSMKHVGVNVASDALMTFAYTGTRGGFVLVTADDPSCHSSQNEQDNRFYALFGGFPLFEPSSPQECYDMAKKAFEVSEELGQPVMLRTTTRVAHVRGPVRVGEISVGPRKKEFVKEPARFVTVPAVARARHLVLLEQLSKAEQMAEGSEFNTILKVENGGRLGIITSSAAANYTIDAAKDMKLHADVLKLEIPACATSATPWRVTRLSRRPYFISFARERAVPLPHSLPDDGERASLDYTYPDRPEQSEPDSDVFALCVDRVVSVTPLSLDLTARVDLSGLDAALRAV